MPNRHRAPERCPVCQGALQIERLACPTCETALEGRFQPGPLARLNDQQQEFIAIFVSCRGNIREVERILGISYPTVRSRLDACIEALDLKPAELQKRPTATERKEILSRLERGEISAKEAIRQIRGDDA